MQLSPSKLIAPILLAAVPISLLILSNLSSAKSLAKSQAGDQRSLTTSQEAVNAWPRKAKRFALIIGVDEYQDTQINKLEGASNDAKMLADALIQYAGFSTDQVILFTKTVLNAPLLAAGMDEPSWQAARCPCQDSQDSLQCGRGFPKNSPRRL